MTLVALVALVDDLRARYISSPHKPSDHKGTHHRLDLLAGWARDFDTATTDSSIVPVGARESSAIDARRNRVGNKATVASRDIAAVVSRSSRGDLVTEISSSNESWAGEENRSELHGAEKNGGESLELNKGVVDDR